MDLGLEMAGIKTVAYVDNDPICRDTIGGIVPRAKVFDDVFDKNIGHFAEKIDKSSIVAWRTVRVNLSAPLVGVVCWTILRGEAMKDFRTGCKIHKTNDFCA